MKKWCRLWKVCEVKGTDTQVQLNVQASYYSWSNRQLTTIKGTGTLLHLNVQNLTTVKVTGNLLQLKGQASYYS